MSDFGRTLHLVPYFICANSEGSGETARMPLRMPSLVTCDKYQNRMRWLGSIEGAATNTSGIIECRHWKICLREFPAR